MKIKKIALFFNIFLFIHVAASSSDFTTVKKNIDEFGSSSSEPEYRDIEDFLFKAPKLTYQEYSELESMITEKQKKIDEWYAKNHVYEERNDSFLRSIFEVLSKYRSFYSLILRARNLHYPNQ